MICVSGRKEMKRYNSGFTSIEILAVLTIVSLLFALGIPATDYVLTQAWEKETRKEMLRIRDAVLIFYENNEVFPTGLATLVDNTATDWDGVYMTSGRNDGESSSTLKDEWDTAYMLLAGSSASERIIRSYGSNRANDNGSGDDLDLVIDTSSILRTTTNREIAAIRIAIEQYNINNNPCRPLPSNILDLIDILQDGEYLEGGNEYLTDDHGVPYLPGPAPVTYVTINPNSSATLPTSDGTVSCGSKVIVCHVPAGSGSPHNMEIPLSSVNAHLAHGDTLGGCCSVINFDTEDDFKTPLVNGQSIWTEPEFGRLVSITSSGDNFGPAIFDSNVGGGNDPGYDSDLLVDLGNILILQENSLRVSVGSRIFSRPDDDGGGGVFHFDFVAPSKPQSVTLVDIDQGNQGCIVTLTDSKGETRVYTVPGGWTRDVASEGPPGYKALDLTIITDQVGYVATATANETPDFDETSVVGIDIFVTASAGIDNLEFCR